MYNTKITEGAVLNKLQHAITRATDIFAQHSVNGWDVKITNSRSTLAVTDHNTKTVELSKRFVLLSTLDEFDGIMHHEIAHIISGPGRGHGDEFVANCKKIGAGDAFSCDNYPIHIKLYKYLCKFCGIVEYNNKKKELLCGKCVVNKGEFINLEVLENTIEAKAW